MANDHYISRFLTGPWEDDPKRRKLHYYDFASGTFPRPVSSKNLFAAAGLHSKTTGDRLNQLIESPVSKYRTALLAGNSNAWNQPSQDWTLFRALVALIRLQPQRLLDRYSPGERAYTLDEMITKGESLLDFIATETQKEHVLIQVELPSSHSPLYFTEGVYFPIPLMGTAPILAVPVTPRIFIATPEKDYDFANDLTHWLRMPGAPSAFSIGLGGVAGVESANKVIIPPELHPLIRTRPVELQKMICTLRDRGVRLFNTFADANEAIGFRAFKFTGGGD
jgi:hypothetical protein